MGVLGLWNILEDLSERKPLKYLSGKTIAVDLSGWVVQAIQCKGLSNAKNPHLRNLFFRVSHLLQNGIFPIFVMEGDLPVLKNDAFKKRNQHCPERSSYNDKISRSSFDRALLQCCDLLQSLGVPCIKSTGEAEAFCAFLCANGIVDGVITEDSDAFLYGADSVYREFTIDRRDPHIRLYCLRSEKNKLNLNRKNLIALALLLGCDYCKGLPGIGKEAALKLLAELPNCDLLQRFKDWTEKNESELFPGYEENIKKGAHCVRCGHLGCQTVHKISGCEACDSKITCYISNETNPCICPWHKSNKTRIERKTELKVYNAAKNVPDFPNKQVIDEFLNFSDNIPEKSVLKWSCPNICDFQEKAEKYLNWTPENSFEKCLPIITSWHQFKASEGLIDKSYLLFEPVKIVKKTTCNKEDCFKVEWKKLKEIGYSTENNEDVCTIEYMDRFSKSYPEVAEAFYSSLRQKKSKPSTKSKPKTKTSKPNDGCQKLTQFFCGPTTSSEDCQRKQNGTQLAWDTSSKRSLEEDVSTGGAFVKKQCI